MSARTRARKRVLDILYEAEMRSASPQDILARTQADSTDKLNEYVPFLVSGILEKKSIVDETIETYSQEWSLDRMPMVDRELARIGVFEILFQEEVPDAVVISEIVELAGSLSTDDSPAFLNGLLGKISSIKHRISID
jgi:N utilization substance protein B